MHGMGMHPVVRVVVVVVITTDVLMVVSVDSRHLVVIILVLPLATGGCCCRVWLRPRHGRRWVGGRNGRGGRRFQSHIRQVEHDHVDGDRSEEQRVCRRDDAISRLLNGRRSKRQAWAAAAWLQLLGQQLYRVGGGVSIHLYFSGCMAQLMKWRFAVRYQISLICSRTQIPTAFRATAYNSGPAFTGPRSQDHV